ncbi:AAA family ATPase [Paenibacillus athensensis]|uniref:Uncharacterized protein n=1 Tax=Paenibacillus athensensis TaxID=1967502 RepID=A0A4Y8PVC6_9BACL|nr:AAA family ATPase [Paenibacillus athensensis]MCD1261853.1 AAA family ATPase [Paenibacillus athensensis]
MSGAYELTLRSYIQENSIDLDRFFPIAFQAVQLLDEQPQNEIAFFPITPDNVMIHAEHGQLKLERTERAQTDFSTDKWAYLSPEHTGRMERGIDQRSSLYGMGMLFYELLTGVLPLKGASAQEWIHAHMAVLPASPQKVNPDIPEALSHLVMKLLAKSIEERYQSVAGVLEDLNKCARQWYEKGRIDPFVLGELDARGRFRLPEQLYGRDMEWQQLLGMYDRIRSGGKGVLFVSGRAGSGKSTFVKALKQHVLLHKGFAEFGKFEPLQEPKPYAAFITVISALIRRLLAGKEEQVARLKTKLLRALGHNGGLLTPVIAELGWLIGEQPPAETLSPLEATSRFQMVFGNLLTALAEDMHPLVIGLEDLQWADSATIYLIRDLVNQNSLRHVWIVGTYRDNELEEGHLLRNLFLSPSVPNNPEIGFISLPALGYPDVSRYVAEALHRDPSEIKPLAHALYRHTAGNPFYLKQMLQICYERGLLFFDMEREQWDCNMDGIRQMDGYHDVIDLIMSKFEALPPETRQTLSRAACLGSSFTLPILALLSERSAGLIEQDLLPAVQESLIVADESGYTFLHDQVQEAAYNSLPETGKKRTHLHIGRFMLRSGQPDNAGDSLFELVHHLNAGSNCMTESAEKDRLARLNLQAGKQAKASAAYNQALELFHKGARLVEAGGWLRSDSLYLQLMLESTECRYFHEDYGQTEADLAQLLEHAGQADIRARIYIIQIKMYTFHKQLQRATEIALRAMRELGLSIPSGFSRLHILHEVARTQMQLKLKLSRGSRPLEVVAVSGDARQQALSEVVMIASAVIFIVKPELAVIMFARYVRLSLRQGLVEAFSIALGSYAITLAYGFGRYQDALRLAEIARYYAEQSGRVLLRGRIEMMTAIILQHLRPRDIAPIFDQAGQLSMACGDMSSAGNSFSCSMLVSDRDLRTLGSVSSAYEEKYGRMFDETTFRVLQISKRFVDLLERNAESSELSFDIGTMSEERLLQEPLLSDEHSGNLLYLYTCKMEVAYVYNRYAEAAGLAEASRHLQARLLESVKQRYCFYSALAIMAVYGEASARSQRAYRQTLRRLMRQMKRWSRSAPDCAVSKLYAMQAEYARISGRPAQAEALYHQAVRYAREVGEPRDEAVAAELAARFHLALGEHTLAEAYLRNACEAYFRWGAFGKVESLRERYPALASLPTGRKDVAIVGQDEIERKQPQPSGYPAAALGPVLDMEILRQASQIRSGGLAETDLLDAFLTLAIHHAGAERGLILLRKQGELVVEVRRGESRSQDTVSRGDDEYAVEVVQFAMNTKEPLVLAEAGQSPFAADPYIQQLRVKSILCLPVRYLDQRTGVLYLENNLVPGAFTAERLEVLEMIFARMVYLRLGQLEDPLKPAAKERQAQAKEPLLIELLTSRELEILRLMAEGLSNKQIALQLEITEGTVKTHANNIYGKLQVNKRVQAIQRARELQLLNDRRSPS